MTEKSTHMYGKDGQEVTNNEDAFAKIEQEVLRKYYVKTFNSELVHTGNLFKKKFPKWVKVTEQVFTSYLNFLKTKSNIQYRLVQRLFNTM